MNRFAGVAASLLAFVFPPGTMAQDENDPPPHAITDLVAVEVTVDSVTLTWTAPSDPGYFGPEVNRFDFRYSTSAITEANFNSANLWSDTPSYNHGGTTPGTMMSTVVTGLTGSPTTTWYFAVKSISHYFIYSGISNIATERPRADSTSPSRVQTLQADAELDPESPDSGTITLRWNSPGDDDKTGTATSYDIRYSTVHAVTESGFGSATPLTGEPLPLLSGRTQEWVITDLVAGQTYYFGLKAMDEDHNLSRISNPASAFLGTEPPDDDDGKGGGGCGGNALPSFAGGIAFLALFITARPIR